MVEAPFQFQAHAVLAFLLLAFWPFTRLVHVFSAPLGYLTRPYIVYRTRDDNRALGSRARFTGLPVPDGQHRYRRGAGVGRAPVPRFQRLAP